jgi:hypothetical protein
MGAISSSNSSEPITKSVTVAKSPDANIQESNDVWDVKDSRVRKWFDLYYFLYFYEGPNSPRSLMSKRQWMHTIARTDIPIGWCKRCGFHVDLFHLVWCPECGLKEPLDLKTEYLNKLNFSNENVVNRNRSETV